MQGEILELGQSLFEVFGSKEGCVVSNLGFGWERKGGDVGGFFFLCVLLWLCMLEEVVVHLILFLDFPFDHCDYFFSTLMKFL